MLDLSQYHVQLAQSEQDVIAAQRLRYQVFVAEGGGDGPAVDHAAGREIDKFDAFADHLILKDVTRSEPDQVVGSYRVMTQRQSDKAGGFSSAAEYDLSSLLTSGSSLLELGRSCVHRDYRRGPALLMLWQALGRHVSEMEIDLVFGVASFPGTDVARWAAPLALLKDRYLADPALRPQARGAGAVPLPDVRLNKEDRKSALADMPPLIKSYLRIGGKIGDGAFVDRDFNTVDVCVVLSVADIPLKDRTFYGGNAP